jgi:hypothetical protein
VRGEPTGALMSCGMDSCDPEVVRGVNSLPRPERRGAAAKSRDLLARGKGSLDSGHYVTSARDEVPQPTVSAFQLFSFQSFLLCKLIPY